MNNCRRDVGISVGQSVQTISAFPENYALAMAYVPFQICNETYDAEKALCQGTVFPALDLPFVGC